MKRIAWLAASLALVTSSCAGRPPDSSTLAVCSISGAVSGTSSTAVTVSLTGARSASTTTDVSGRYAFSALPSGTYTVTPFLAGYIFSPSSVTAVTTSDSNVTAQDFAATASVAPAHGISGSVTNQESAAVLAGAVLNLSGASTASTATDPSGTYAFSGLLDGSYTVTPSLAGYVFSPASIGVSVNGGDVTGQNFASTASVAPTHSISGNVTNQGSGTDLAGAVLTLSGAGTGSTATDLSGNYAFSGLLDGSYTVTPSLTGYVFSPGSIGVSVNGGDVTAQNFTGNAVWLSVASGTPNDLYAVWGSGASDVWAVGMSGTIVQRQESP